MTPPPTERPNPDFVPSETPGIVIILVIAASLMLIVSAVYALFEMQASEPMVGVTRGIGGIVAGLVMLGFAFGLEKLYQIEGHLKALKPGTRTPAKA